MSQDLCYLEGRISPLPSFFREDVGAGSSHLHNGLTGHKWCGGGKKAGTKARSEGDFSLGRSCLYLDPQAFLSLSFISILPPSCRWGEQMRGWVGACWLRLTHGSGEILMQGSFTFRLCQRSSEGHAVLKSL